MFLWPDKTVIFTYYGFQKDWKTQHYLEHPKLIEWIFMQPNCLAFNNVTMSFYSYIGHKTACVMRVLNDILRYPYNHNLEDNFSLRWQS